VGAFFRIHLPGKAIHEITRSRNQPGSPIRLIPWIVLVQTKKNIKSKSNLLEF